MKTVRKFAHIAATLLALGAVHHTTPARANGRYPQAMQVAADPSDPNRLWLRSTYGLVSSTDRGATWSLVCEAALGMDPNGIFDPMFGVHADGSIAIGLQKGLKRSTDRGCDWRHVVPELEESFVQDITVDVNDRRRGLAISSFFADTSYSIEVWETQNNGASYTRVSRMTENDYGRTIDAAPSNPNRVYMSVMAFDVSDFSKPGVPALLISNDRGKNWTRSELPVPPNSDPYIAAVHPTNADVLYVRTYEELRLETGNDIGVKSRLLYSDNGGTTFREILSGDAPMLGFAQSPDGTEVLVGFGDEGDSRKNLVAPDGAFGIRHASTSDFRFQRVYDQKVSCLNWTGNDIYVCSRLEETGFDLGLFNNTCPATIRPLFNKKRMTGVLSCAAGTTTAQACTKAAYDELCNLKLYCSEPWPATDGGTASCWEGGVYEGGTNDASPNFDAGVGGSAGDASVRPDGGPARRNDDDGSDGCSCRQARRDARLSPALLAASIAVGLGLRRRRRVLR